MPTWKENRMSHESFSLPSFFSSTAFEILGYQLTYLELFATVTSLVGVCLGVIGARITWPWWVSGSVLYGLLFWQWELYASAMLQVVFIIAGIWGWFGWGPSGAKPATLRVRERIIWALLLLAGWLLLTPLFSNIGAAATTLDTFILVGSMVAQILMVLEKYEAWVIWFAVDIVGTVHYYRQDLWFTSVLYAVFTVVAVIGFRRWLRESYARSN
jgi:nicotinamide mononucleotide transporter